MQGILQIVLDYVKLVSDGENSILIPKSDFSRIGISPEMVAVLSEKILREEGAMNCWRTLVPVFSSFEYEGWGNAKKVNPEIAKMNYELAKEDYKNNKDNLLFIIGDKEKLKELLERVNFRVEHLVCGKVKLNINTGDLTYNKIKSNLKPGSQQYIFLRILMENPDKPIGSNKIKEAINKNSLEPVKSSIDLIMRDLKRKLKIIGKIKKKNKNVFRHSNQYMIVSNPK